MVTVTTAGRSLPPEVGTDDDEAHLVDGPPASTWQDAEMSAMTPETPLHWGDATGNQQGPAPAAEVVDRIRRGELPPNTPLWWPEAAGWTPADQVPELAGQLGVGTGAGASAPAAPDPAATAAPAAPATPGGTGGHATDVLMDGLTDQQLDDEFMGLIDRSWSMYKQAEKATTIDEVMLGGIITAMVDSGFVMIDIHSGGLVGPAAANGPVPPPPGTHEMRFEAPTTGARVTISLRHLTPDLASASVIGHRARLEVGYGERLGNASQIGQALRSEVASSFVAVPEPGSVTFDADITSGYVYASIDVLVEPDRYVDDDLAVDHDTLRRHIAALVYTMRTFVQTRFAS